MNAEFVEELWDVAIFTRHGIVMMRDLIERPRFDPAYAEAMIFLNMDDDSDGEESEQGGA